MAKVLVTGGAGFIGSHLVDALLLAGHHVRVLDNLEPQVHGRLHELKQKPEYLDPEAEFLYGDIRDPEIVRKALDGIEVVFHEAALVGVGQSMYDIARYTGVNTQGSANLLQSIIDARQRPRKLIVASSMSIYGEGAYLCPVHGDVFPGLRNLEQLAAQDWELYCPQPGCNEHVVPVPTTEGKPLHPNSIYAINKRDHEEMFLTVGRAYQIPTVALRYFNVYGPRQALSNPYTGVAAIFSGRLLNHQVPIIFEDGCQLRDFTHVSDIVQGNLLVIDNPNADYCVFNVGTGRPVSIYQVAQALIGHLEVNIQPVVSRRMRAGDIRHCYADINSLQGMGYQPRRTFESGISELVEWVRTQTVVDRFDDANRELAGRGLTS